MSSNLGVGKILDLLERLKGTVRDLAARADKLNTEFQARTGREQRLREAAAGKAGEELAAAIGEAEAAFAAAREAAQAKFEARKAWIGKAYQASKEKALAGVETQTGTRKYELQKKMLQAERDRERGPGRRGDRARGVQSQRWRRSRRRWRRWKRRLQGVSRATGSSSASCRTPTKRPLTPDAAKDEHQLLAELREVLGKTRGDLGQFPEVPVAARVQVPAGLGAAGACARFRWSCRSSASIRRLTRKRVCARWAAWSLS